MTVSDRASALLQLTKVTYLDTCSFPDLFHFMQDLGKSVGGRLGLQVSRAAKKLSQHASSACSSEGSKLEDYANKYSKLEADLLEKQIRLDAYKQEREGINQLLHPFDEQDGLTDTTALEGQLQRQFTRIRKLAQQAAIELPLNKAQKILRQIPDLCIGMAHWLQYLHTQIQTLTNTLGLNVEQVRWIKQVLLPYAYWQVHWTKTTRRKKDKRLNQYYRKRCQQALQRLEITPLPDGIDEQTKERLVNWAFAQVATFHRASSQVEGRNGYLAFFHHANRAITSTRKKVLTVVHNFDIRREDGKTPAQRLFKKDFPDLFEFVLQQIEELPKPRNKKMKRGLTN